MFAILFCLLLTGNDSAITSVAVVVNGIVEKWTDNNVFVKLPGQNTEFSFPVMNINEYLTVILCLNLFSCNSDSDSVPAIPKPKVTVETYAGSTQGSNDGSALTAEFDEPEWITVTPNGDAYVVDQHGGAIRKISTSGAVTTEFTTELKDISGITSDDHGEVYFSTTARIQRLNGHAAPEVIAYGITNESSGFFQDLTSIAVHPDGSIYFFDSGNNRLMRTTLAGKVSVVAGGIDGYLDGPLAEARFGRTSRISITKSGDIYICDGEGDQVRKISGGVVKTFSNNKNDFVENPPEFGMFNYPIGALVSSDGSVYVSLVQGNMITKIGTGPIASQVGTMGYKDGDGTIAQFRFAYGIAFDADENILVCDLGNHLIRKVIIQ